MGEPISNPADVFSQIVTALQRSDWTRVADLCDPISLDLARQQFVRSYDSLQSDSSPRPTADDYKKGDPELPDAVAEYYVRRAATHRDVNAEIRENFAGIQSFEQLCAASPTAVFSAWLHAHSLQGQLEHQVENGQLPRQSLEAAAESLRFQYDFVPLGFVEDQDGLAHVLYRSNARAVDNPSSELSGDEMVEQSIDERVILAALWDNPPAVASLRRQSNGSWRILASERFLTGIGSGWSFVSMIAAEPSEEDPGPDA